jgi:hypothetical protein
MGSRNLSKTAEKSSSSPRTVGVFVVRKPRCLNVMILMLLDDLTFSVNPIHSKKLCESDSVVSRLDMYRTKVLMYRTMVLLARLTKVRRLFVSCL